jgi:glutaredoxin
MNVVIYTKDDCHFCTNAKTLLATKGIGYTEMKLNEDFTREFLVENYPSAKSFPLIVIDGFYIGGYEQLKNKLNESSNNTQKLLNEGSNA